MFALGSQDILNCQLNRGGTHSKDNRLFTPDI